MKIVVDSNILFAALLRGNDSILHRLLHKNVEVYAPQVLLEEVFNHASTILSHTRLAPDRLFLLFSQLLSHITFIPEGLLSIENRKTAYRLCKDYDEHDSLFVAVALEMDATYWTRDNIRRHLMKQGFTAFFEEEKMLPISGKELLLSLQRQGITASAFLEVANILNTEHCILQYVYSYSRHKKLHPDSQVSKEDYQLYFGSGAKIEKLLSIEPVRILCKYSFLRVVTLIIPFKGTLYSVEIDKKTVEHYFQINLQELRETPSAWQTFVSQYSSPVERKKFMEHFVQTKEWIPED